jgi:hypothetical protein
MIFEAVLQPAAFSDETDKPILGTFQRKAEFSR